MRRPAPPKRGSAFQRLTGEVARSDGVVELTFDIPTEGGSEASKRLRTGSQVDRGDVFQLFSRRSEPKQPPASHFASFR